MPLEIERKFLAAPSAARGRRGRTLRQAYFTLARGDGGGRVRLDGSRAWLTIKTGRRGIARREIESPIRRAMARELLRTLCVTARVQKRRYERRYDGRRWEIDVFEGANRGLVMAEIELRRANERIRLPPWVGKEVTHDPRFNNSALARRPFGSWSAAEKAAVAAEIRAADMAGRKGARRGSGRPAAHQAIEGVRAPMRRREPPVPKS